MCLYEHLIKAQTEIHIINNNLSFIKNKTIQQEFEQLNKLITDILTPDFTDIASEYKKWKTSQTNYANVNNENNNVNLKESNQFKNVKNTLTNLYIEELTNNPENHKDELINTLTGLNNYTYTAKITVKTYNNEHKEKTETLTFNIVVTADCNIESYTTDLNNKTNLYNKLNMLWNQKIIRKFNVVNCNELITKLLKTAENNNIKHINKTVELTNTMEMTPNITINIEDYLNNLPFMTKEIETQIKLLKEKLTTIPTNITT